MTRSLTDLIYTTLSLPDPSEDGDAAPIGTLTPATSPQIVDKLVSSYRGQPGLSRIFTYKDYLHAVAHQETYQSQMHRYDQWLYSDQERAEPFVAVDATTKEFLITHFVRSRHTPDRAGYLHYLSDAAPDLHEILSTPAPLMLAEKHRKEHTFIVATTGRGKSELVKLLIHSDILEHRSAVVLIEPSGDLAPEVAQFKELAKGDRLIYVDPKLKPGMTPTINPFEIPGISAADTSERARDAKRVIAQQLLGAFQEAIGTGVGSGLTVPMRAILMPCILTLLDIPGATIRDLRRFMEDKNNDDLIAFGSTRTHYPDVKDFFDSGFSDNHYAATKTAIATKLRLLLNTGTFADLTCGPSTIDLEDALAKRRVVVFNLAKGSIGEEEGAAFGRLMIALLQGIAERRVKLPKHKRYPCHVFLDECHNYITPSVAGILKEARKYRTMLTLCQQIPGDGMSAPLASVVFGTTVLKIVGLPRSSQAAATSSDFVHTPAEDLLTLDLGEFYLQWSNKPPFKLKTHTHLLGDTNSMVRPLWNRTKKKQLRQYYRALDAPTSAPSTPPPDNSTPPPTDDGEAPRQKRRLV